MLPDCNQCLPQPVSPQISSGFPQIVDMETGAVSETGLPKSNVLYFELPNNCWCCARPSGTEPKIKFYMGVVGNSLEDAQSRVEKLTEDLKSIL